MAKSDDWKDFHSPEARATDDPFPVTDLRPAYRALQDAVNANLETLAKAISTWSFGGRLHSHIQEVECTSDCIGYQALKLRPGDQPLPVKNDAPDVQSQVIADVEERRQLGIQRYGTALQPHNGRDALRDAYEEAIDLAMYLKQAILEREGFASESDKLKARLAEVAGHDSPQRVESGGGVWMAFNRDGSAVVPFATEIEAYRHAAPLSMTVEFITYGSDVI